MTETFQTLDVKGRSIHVAYRPGEGRPLLMCNGIGASLGMLQPFVDALDPSIPVIRFDVPGIGRSPIPRLPYRYSTLSCLLGQMLDELDVKDVDVLGISWGGALAQQFAFQNPRRCRRLVLVSTGPGSVMVPASPRVLRHMITPRRYRDANYATEVAPTIYGGRLREDPSLLREFMGGHTVTPGRGYMYQLFAGAGWSSLPGLPLIRQKTLILSGDDDPLIPLVNAKVMAALIPRARLEVFHDGHLALVTRADELAPMVASFLREPETAALAS